MEHALHLVTKHFVKEVAPTPASALLKIMTGEDEDNNEVTDFEVANTAGKALTFITQVSVHPCLPCSI
jgi:hypothetical protein